MTTSERDPVASPADSLSASAKNNPSYPRNEIARLRRRVAEDPVLSDFIHYDKDQAIGRFDEEHFESRFTALCHLASPNPLAAERTPPPPIGWRASLLARDHNATWSSSTALFESIDNPTLLVLLDRMTRALHALNFFASQTAGLLFLPVHERLLKSVRYDHGKHFATVLLSLGLNPERVVIEIPRAAVAHKTFLAYLVKSYRAHGFKLAANLASAASILSLQTDASPDFIIADVERSRREGMIEPLLSYANRIRSELIFDGLEDHQTQTELAQYGVRYAAAVDAHKLALHEPVISS